MDSQSPEVNRRQRNKPLAALASLGLAITLGGCVEEDAPHKQKDSAKPVTFSCESVKYIENDTRPDYIFIHAVDRDGSETSVDAVTAQMLGSTDQPRELTPLVDLNNRTDTNRYAIDISPKTSQLVIKLHKGTETARCPTLNSPLKPFNPPTQEPTSS